MINSLSESLRTESVCPETHQHVLSFPSGVQTLEVKQPDGGPDLYHTAMVRVLVNYHQQTYGLKVFTVAL